MGFHTGKHGKVYNDDKKSHGSKSNSPGSNDGSSTNLRADNLPDRELTQDELQNMEIEVTDAQAENQKILERDIAKAEAKGDTRSIWEIRAEQINYNHKQVDLWEKMDDKTKTKLLKDNGIEDNKIKENLNKSFMELGKQDGYGDSDFRQYLAPEINAHYGLPTEWYDK